MVVWRIVSWILVGAGVLCLLIAGVSVLPGMRARLRGRSVAAKRKEMILLGIIIGVFGLLGLNNFQATQPPTEIPEETISPQISEELSVTDPGFDPESLALRFTLGDVVSCTYTADGETRRVFEIPDAQIASRLYGYLKNMQLTGREEGRYEDASDIFSFKDEQGNSETWVFENRCLLWNGVLYTLNDGALWANADEILQAAMEAQED